MQYILLFDYILPDLTSFSSFFFISFGAAALQHRNVKIKCLGNTWQYITVLENAPKKSTFQYLFSAIQNWEHNALIFQLVCSQNAGNCREWRNCNLKLIALHCLPNTQQNTEERFPPIVSSIWFEILKNKILLAFLFGDLSRRIL